MTEAQAIDQQVCGLGHPVRQGRTGELGPLTGGVVIEGHQWRRGIGGDDRRECLDY